MSQCMKCGGRIECPHHELSADHVVSIETIKAKYCAAAEARDAYRNECEELHAALLALTKSAEELLDSRAPSSTVRTLEETCINARAVLARSVIQ